MFRNFSLTLIAIFASIASASAADLPTEKGPPVYAPPPPPAFSWTGFYIGGQVGYAWGDTSYSSYLATTGAFVATSGHSDDGVIGGLHAGYNYQINQFVVGIEGDVNGSNYNGNNTVPVAFAPPPILGGPPIVLPYVNSTHIPIEGSIRGRVGIAFDRVLVFGTGGVALASVRNSETIPSLGLVDSDTAGRVGWTVGGGIEYAIDNNWSVRAQYLYTDYGSFTYNLANTTLGLLNLHVHTTQNQATVGFSYKFDEAPPPAPPVVAKY